MDVRDDGTCLRTYCNTLRSCVADELRARKRLKQKRSRSVHGMFDSRNTHCRDARIGKHYGLAAADPLR